MRSALGKPFAGAAATLATAALALGIALGVAAGRAALDRPQPLDAVNNEQSLLAGRLQGLFSELAQAARPAVVAVGSTERPPSAFVGQEAFENVFSGDEDAPRRVSLGTGVIVDRRGFILTNSHVVASGNDLRVTLWNGKRLVADLVQRNEAFDIALLKVDAADLVPMPLGDSDDLKVGHWVLAVGNPFGLTHSVSAGIVSALGRTDIGILPYESFIQTDASIHQGNSGGPMMNLAGELVGINTAIYSSAGGSNLGIGFAVPINLIKGLVGRWMSGRGVAWLGVDTRNVDAAMARYFGLEERRGAFVSRVHCDSNGEKAGLLAKDIILRVGDVDIASSDHLKVLVAESEPGRAVALDVWRGRERRRIEVTLEEQGVPEPAAFAARPGAGGSAPPPLLGISISPVNGELTAHLELAPGTVGLVIVEVEADSPADNAGLRPGDLIVQVNEVAVANVDDFETALARSTSSTLLEVRRPGLEPGYFFFLRGGE